MTDSSEVSRYSDLRKQGSVVALLLLAAACYAALTVSLDVGFPYWDYAWYHDQTVATADAFRGPLRNGLRFVEQSMVEDYNRLFTLPLIPGSSSLGNTGWSSSSPSTSRTSCRSSC